MRWKKTSDPLVQRAKAYHRWVSETLIELEKEDEVGEVVFWAVEVALKVRGRRRS